MKNAAPIYISVIFYTLYHLYHVSYQSLHLVLDFLLQFYHVFQLDHGFLLLSLGKPTYARQTATELTSEVLMWTKQ